MQGRCPCRSARCLRTNSFSFILRRLRRRKIKLTLGVLVTLLRVMRRFEHGEYIFCCAYRNRSSRTLGTLFDGIARHTQDGFNSVSRAKEAGFRQPCGKEMIHSEITVLDQVRGGKRENDSLSARPHALRVIFSYHSQLVFAWRQRLSTTISKSQFPAGLLLHLLNGRVGMIRL